MLNRVQCVLIAENEDNDFISLTQRLKEAGLEWRVFRTTSIAGLRSIFERGLEGDDAKDCEFPEILFLSPRLSDGNALQMLAQLKTMAPRKVVVVVMSKHNEVSMIREAYQAGADTIFQKPIVLQELMDFLLYRGIVAAK